MTEINKVKLLESLDNEIRYYHGLNDRNSSDVRLMLEAFKTKVEKGRFDIEPSDNSSLITTIEQQKIQLASAKLVIQEGISLLEQSETTIESLQGDMEAAEIGLKSYREEVESQKEEIKRLMGVNQHLKIDLSESKAITELAVKGLQEIETGKGEFSAVFCRVIARNTLSEIEGLQK